MEGTPSRYAVVWQTIAAIFVGIITFVVAAFLTNTVIVLSGYAPSDEGASPLAIDISRAIFPSIAGVGAARYICDYLFKYYYKRAIFLFFVALSVPIFAMAFRSGGRSWDHVLAFLSAASLAATALALFWAEAPLPKKSSN